MLLLKRLSSDFLYNELVTVLFNPSNRSLGALSFEQISDKLPSLLPVGQSILLVWQDIIAIVAATLICFVISYGLFMRREIREWERSEARRVGKECACGGVASHRRDRREHTERV